MATAFYIPVANSSNGSLSALQVKTTALTSDVAGLKVSRIVNEADIDALQAADVTFTTEMEDLETSMIERIRCRGEWQPMEMYQTGNTVLYNGGLYQALEDIASTNGPDVDSFAWILLASDLSSTIAGYAIHFNTDAIDSVGSTLTIGADSTTSTVALGTGSGIQTVNIGTGPGVTSINLGAAGDTVSIAGTLATINVTNVDVADKLMRLNKGGLSSSGFSTGIEVEESSSAAGYVKTSADRLSWQLKAPGSATVMNLNQSLATTDSPTFVTVTGNLTGNAATVTTIPALSGEATSSGSSNAVTLSASAVIAKPLTGYAKLTGAITSSDTILSAIQKADGNTLVPQGVWSSSTTYAKNNVVSYQNGIYSASVANTNVAPGLPATVSVVDQVVPAQAISDGNASELGLTFTPQTNGFVYGVTFYKYAGNTATHVGRLWSTAGTSLASVTFTGETASGWQSMNFGTPVAVTSGTSYVVSCNLVTQYAGGTFYNYPIVNGNLTAVSSTRGYGAPGVFPGTATAWNNTYFGVDILFAPVNSWTIISPPPSGTIVANLTGNVSGSSGSCTGNAATATTATNFSGSLSGNVTGTQGATVISNATVVGKQLTGYSSTTGAVSATDTIVSGISKLNGNMAAFLINTAAPAGSVAIGTSTLSVSTAIATAIGFEALKSLTNGVNNAAFGYQALRLCTTGGGNCAVGSAALGKCTTGGGNMAVGENALRDNVGGSFNVAIGSNAAQQALGSASVSIGFGANLRATTAGESIGIGHFCAQNATTAKHCSIGYNCSQSLTTASDCTVFGNNAGNTISTAGSNTIIGSLADIGLNTHSNSTALGYGAVTTASNQVRLGNGSVTMVSTAGEVNCPSVNTLAVSTASVVSTGVVTAAGVITSSTQVTTPAFLMATSAGSGKVLTSDGSGNGTWAALTGTTTNTPSTLVGRDSSGDIYVRDVNATGFVNAFAFKPASGLASSGDRLSIGYHCSTTFSGTWSAGSGGTTVAGDVNIFRIGNLVTISVKPFRVAVSGFFSPWYFSSPTPGWARPNEMYNEAGVANEGVRCAIASLMVDSSLVPDGYMSVTPFDGILTVGKMTGGMNPGIGGVVYGTTISFIV